MKTSDLVINKHYFPFLLLSFGLLLNSFFNSLAVSYGYSEYYITSFLYTSSDLHADLLKGALSFSGLFSKDVDVSTWASLYQSYYYNNPYGGIENLQNNKLSHFSSLPIYTLISFFTNKMILEYSPEIVVICFYIFVFFSTFIVSKIYLKTMKKSMFFSIVFLLSYPVLFMLTRGHIFSFLLAGFLIIFIDLVVKKDKRLWLIILILIIATNFRPNVILLSALFFIYGFRSGIKYSIVYIVGSLVFYFILYSVVNNIYPDYNMSNFFKSLNFYYHNYVLGSAGSEFNNSLFGGIKLILINNNLEFSFELLNRIILFIVGVFILTAYYLFYTRKITRYVFAFIVVSSYILASSVFATYHLIVFFIFLLIPFKYNRDFLSNNNIYVIISLTIFILIPKNYYHFSSISIETILNPIVLFLGCIYILLSKLLNDKKLVFSIIISLSLFISGLFFYENIMYKEEIVKYDNINYDIEKRNFYVKDTSKVNLSKGSEVVIEFGFKYYGYREYNNIFQTDDINDGIRLEFSKDNKLVLLSKTVDNKLTSFIISDNVELNKNYNVYIKYRSDKIIIELNKKVVIEKDVFLNASFKNLAVGYGFVKERYFNGIIKNFKIEYKNRKRI